MNKIDVSLNAATRTERLEALKGLVADSSQQPPPLTREVNNHVHTTYSFSPYSPTAAAWQARQSALSVVGSIDHDSIGAAGELREAAALVGLGSTTGVEVRCDFSATPFADRGLNNPERGGIAYIVIHGVPASARRRFDNFLAPRRAARSERSRKITENLSDRLTAVGCDPIDYERDVLPLSRFSEGGGITERHILFAAAERVLEAVGPAGSASPADLAGSASSREGGSAGRAGSTTLIDWLSQKLKISVPDSIRPHLSDPDNPILRYDLLGLFKREVLPEVYIRPSLDECPPVADLVTLALESGAIPAYPYLGDIEDSPTGDKRPDQFEDSHLDELIPWVRESGFVAVTYMPPRNTRQQLARLSALCRENRLIEVSGVDINTPRQSFNCPEVLDPDYEHLIDSAWALAAHERVVDVDPSFGLAGDSPLLRALSPPKRVGCFAAAAQTLSWDRDPDGESLLEALKKEVSRG